MKRGLLIIGVILIVLGALALAYEGIAYTTSEKVFKAGPIEPIKEARKTLPLPPLLSGVAAAAGIIMVFGTFRKSS